MNKKTGLTSKETKMLLSHGFFNKRYIVRNTLAATVLVTFLVIAIGITAVVTGDAAEEENSISNDKLIEQSENDSRATTEELNQSVDIALDNTDEIETTQEEKATEEVDAEVSALDTNLVTNSKYENTFIAVEGGINIRSGADTDYDAIAYLERGMVGEYLGTEGEWSKIAVGDLVGYVLSEYILVGSAAVDFAEANYYDIDNASYYEAAEETADAEEPVDADEEEQNAEDFEEDTEATEEDVTEETSEEITTEEVVWEEETEEATTEEVIEEEETEEATEETTEEVNAPAIQETVNRGAFSLSEEDITLIAAIVANEAGSEPYEGQVAVANVVLNRLLSGYWGNTISGVVYAPNQFDVVYSAGFKSYVESGAHGTSLQATLEAVSGTNNIGNRKSFRPTYFLNNNSFDNYIVIGNHLFF